MSIDERDYARGRAERKRRLQQRQTLVYGSLILVLGIVLLIAWLQWSQAIPSPFAREFTTEDTPQISETVACPAPGDVMMAPGDITATVLNSTPTSGLAGDVADQLRNVGIVVETVGNWDESVLASQGVIEVGPAAVVEGYSLQSVLPGMPVMQVDREDTSVTVVIGTQFSGVADAAAFQPGSPISIPEVCLTSAPATDEAETAATEPTP